VIELSVIIVNWNSKDFVRRCLTSLYANCKSVHLEAIVVDGGSFDGCGEMLAAEFRSAKFVQLEKNVGFAKANNLGVRHAQSGRLLFLNPDTELLEDSVQVLMAQLTALPKAGAVGCRLLNADRSLQLSSVMAFPTVLNQVINSDYLKMRFPKWKMWGIAPLFDKSRNPSVVEAISGACMLVHRKAFEAVGGFTEDYFMYGEDVDFCFKIAKAGYHVYHVPGTSMVHFGGGSSGQAKSNFSNVMMRESVRLFLRKSRGVVSAAVYRAAMAVSSVARLVLILVLLPFSRDRVVRHGSGSLRKWFSILRWGLGLESWVRSREG
jgi:GT2 family glycosyltransferase